MIGLELMTPMTSRANKRVTVIARNLNPRCGRTRCRSAICRGRRKMTVKTFANHMVITIIIIVFIIVCIELRYVYVIIFIVVIPRTHGDFNQ